jgi:Domain of unknown function (DUF4864)
MWSCGCALQHRGIEQERRMLLRRLLFVIILLSAWAPMAGAQTPDEPRIREVITRQLDAMNRGDDAAAFAIASPAIQTLFQDAPTFMRMVQQGYPQVYRSRGHRFLKLDTSDGRLIQRVLVESEAGTVVARYEMVEIDGAWRISGCAIEQGEGA